MSVFYETVLHVGAGEAGLHFQCRPAGVLSMLQEAATQAAAGFHASGPEMLEKYNGLWMVTRMWYQLERPLMWNDRVTVRTWHRGGKGAALYRDFDLLIDGKPVGEAVSLWVLADADSRRLIRLSTVEELTGTDGGGRCKERKLTAIRMPENMRLAESRKFHYSDIDCNGHVNNVRYADLLSDAVGLETYSAKQFVSALQIGYIRECLAGERISLYTGTGENGLFVHGVGEEKDSRFDGWLALDNLPEED